MGHVSGDSAALVDNVRYNTITEATFAAYFTFGNAADPCVVTGYQLLSENVGPTLYIHAQASLDGSFGSYEFKIDKNHYHTTEV